MMEASYNGREVARLNRHTWKAGEPEQILIHYAPQDKYPVEVFVFDRLHKPLSSRFIAAPPAAPTMNGQLVNRATHLMCSKCCQWKPDADFRKDSRRGPVRRGRMYYCRHCLSRWGLYQGLDPNETHEIVRGRPKKKRSH